jgi:predicted lipoprotein with Yx(FWY)xxD motif
MRAELKFLIPALASSLTLAACGSSSGSSQSASQTAATASTAASAAAGSEGAALVRSAANPTLASTVLVNSSGMTLYSLSGEQGGKFICTSSACLAVWHPLTATTATPSGSVGSLATVKRPDGTEQITYKGMPLYTFTGDTAAGDAKGQGLKDVGTWAAVTVSAGGGTATAPATTPTAPSSSGSSSGSSKKYGY